MIRKAALQIAAFALLGFIAFNAYVAVSHLKQIQKAAALALQGSLLQTQIAQVSQDLTDMETGQRGYLITADVTYLQPYTDAKGRLANDFARLGSGLSKRADREQLAEARLESLAGSMQTEIERTIAFRQQGYRHRAFLLVDTNEGKSYMDEARGLVSSLSSMEDSRFMRFKEQREVDLRKALSQILVANSCLLMLAGLLFWLTRHHDHLLEKEAAKSKQALAVRDSQLERTTDALCNQTRSEIAVIDENVRWLLDEYGPFLPRQGYECAERIKDAATKLERLRGRLVGIPDSKMDLKAA